jgi:hypothetical protein
MNCDSIYYFSENGQKYALLLLRHRESGRKESHFGELTSYYNSNTWTFQKMSFLMLKFSNGKWMPDFFKDATNYLDTEELGIIFYAIEFKLPKIHIYGRDLIFVEKHSKMKNGTPHIFNREYIIDSTFIYDTNRDEPIYKFRSFLSTNFSDYEEYSSAFSKIDMLIEVENNIPFIRFKFTDKATRNEKIEKLSNELKDMIGSDKTDFYAEYKYEKQEMIKLSKQSVNIYDLLKKNSEISIKDSVITPLRYFQKKYTKLTDKEAYDLIAGKSLSYYYKCDIFNNNHIFFQKNCVCGSCLLPYVDHLFLKNGEYYKISNEYRNLGEICNFKIPDDSHHLNRCTDLFPNVVKKGSWKIIDNRLILDVREESNWEQRINYKIFGISDTFKVKSISRSGWPYSDTIDINVFSNLESLLYEIAESECRFGYSIGDPLFQKQAATSGEIMLTNKPFGLDNYFYKCGNDYYYQIKNGIDENKENAMTIEKFLELINSYYKKLD